MQTYHSPTKVDTKSIVFLRFISLSLSNTGAQESLKIFSESHKRASLYTKIYKRKISFIIEIFNYCSCPPQLNA